MHEAWPLTAYLHVLTLLTDTFIHMQEQHGLYLRDTESGPSSKSCLWLIDAQ